MPVTIRKVSKTRYQVRTPGGIKSKMTTKANAEAQKRIIEESDKRRRS